MENSLTKLFTGNISVRPEVEAVRKHIEVEAGEAAELECKVTRGSPDPEVIWRRKVRCEINQTRHNYKPHLKLLSHQ